MIHREAWYKEAFFDEQIRLLLEQAYRGLITPEEFTHRMLRYHSSMGDEDSPVSLLDLDEAGELVQSQAWLLAHRTWIQEATDHREQLERGMGYLQYQVGYPLRQLDYLLQALFFIRVMSPGDLLPSRRTGTFPDYGDWGNSFTTEQEFNEWVRGTLKVAQKTVSALGERLINDPA